MTVLTDNIICYAYGGDQMPEDVIPWSRWAKEHDSAEILEQTLKGEEITTEDGAHYTRTWCLVQREKESK